MLLAYLVFNWGRCLLWTTRGLSGPTKQLQSLCSKCACPTQNWRAWTTMWQPVPKTESFVFLLLATNVKFLRTNFSKLTSLYWTVKEIGFIQVLKANYFGWCRGENAWLACLVVSSLGVEASWWWGRFVELELEKVLQWALRSCRSPNPQSIYTETFWVFKGVCWLEVQKRPEKNFKIFHHSFY